MLKHTLTAAALAAVLATPAFAQKQPAPDTTKQMQSAPAPQGAMSNHKTKTRTAWPRKAPAPSRPASCTARTPMSGAVPS